MAEETGRVDKKETAMGREISTRLEAGEMERVDKKERGRGGGQWGGGDFTDGMLGGHTFPEQCRVTQLVYVKIG